MDSANLSTEEQAIYREIRTWNFYNEIDQVGPSIWKAWWDALYPMIWDELQSDSEALKSPFAYQTIYLLTKHPNDPFMDIQETHEVETAPDLYVKSFQKAATLLSDWKRKNGNYLWKDYKGTYVGHLLQGLPAFSRFDIPIGGDRGIVNATSKNHGASWRMIVEMSSPPKALGIYPGGQSGNPGSAYYDNFIGDWAAGNYHELNFMQNQDAAIKTIGTQTLTPSKHE